MSGQDQPFPANYASSVTLIFVFFFNISRNGLSDRKEPENVNPCHAE